MKQILNDVVLGLRLLGAGLLIWVIAGPAHGMSGAPPSGLACDPETITPEGERYIRCVSQDYRGADILIRIMEKKERIWPLVMTLAKRSTEPVGKVKDASPWDKRYDVSDPYIFTPGDSIVVDDMQGNVTYVHDCRGKACAATDAKVSPDGTRIMYQVMWGDNWESIAVPGATLPNRQMHADYADLYVHVLAEGRSYRITNNREAGISDMHPHWRSNSSIVFVSNREKYWAPWAPAGSVHPINPSNAYNAFSLQLHKAELKAGSLSGVVNWRPHAWMDMNPWVMTTGHTCVSAWEGADPRQYGTPANAFWITCVDYNGADEVVELGAHTGGRGTNFEVHSLIDDWARVSVERQDEFRALRPVVEIARGWLAASNYYRTNMMGCGIDYAWSFTPQTEGACKRRSIAAATQYGDSDQNCSGRYVPPDVFVLTPYGHAQDSSDVRRTIEGNLPTGRACEVAPHPSGGYLLTHMVGGAPVFWPAEKYSDAFMMGQPLAKLQVHLVPSGEDGRPRPVGNPFDNFPCIAGCDLDVHASKPQAIATYGELYGQPAPTPLPPLTGTDAGFQVVNLRDAGLDPIPGMTDQKSRVTFQGNAHPAYSAIVTEFCVQYVQMWDTKPTRTGHKALLDTTCAEPLADGSLELPLRHDEPFLHFGRGVIDDKGTVAVVAKSEKLDSVRKGEKRSCHGCHAGHASETAYDRTAAERFADTLAGRGE